MANLKHRDNLLADIADQLSNHVLARASMIHIRVRLYVAKDTEPVKEYLGLNIALHDIVNDVYWDEEGNWADASRAQLDTY